MENLLLLQANNKENIQLNARRLKLQRALKEKCFNCDEVGHQKSNCPNPKKAKVKKCFVCNQAGHVSKACPKVINPQTSTVGEKNDNLQEVTLFQVNEDYPYTDCCVTADIDGVDVYCQLSTGTTCNIMEEDVWQRIAREGGSHAILDTNRTQKLKTLIGTFFKPLGRVHLPVKFKGIKYDLDWVVVPNGHIPVKACLGTPFTRHMIIDYSKSVCDIRPYKENQNPDTEELVQREIQKLKDQVNKRTEMFLYEQKKYLQEQMETIKVNVEKKKLENGIKKTIKKIRENAA